MQWFQLIVLYADAGFSYSITFDSKAISMKLVWRAGGAHLRTPFPLLCELRDVHPTVCTLPRTIFIFESLKRIMSSQVILHYIK